LQPARSCMRPERGDLAFLWDMLDAARAIQEFVAGKKLEEYARDRMMRGAVERHIEIIGEAARNLSESLRGEHPEIPWRTIIAQRNVLHTRPGNRTTCPARPCSRWRRKCTDSVGFHIIKGRVLFYHNIIEKPLRQKR
jgi:uncharacterized protein with HEPN domain